MGCDKRFYNLRSEHIVGDSKQGKIFRFKALVQSFQRGHFHFAGTAPGGPKIHQNVFTSLLAKADFFSVERFESKVWRR